MKKLASSFSVITLFAAMPFFLILAFAQSSVLNAQGQWKSVEQALGRTGQAQPDGAYKFGMPRGDLKVTVSGVEVKPALALGSWLAFSSPGENAMMMGDLVLTEDEVSSVMAKLAQGGVEVTALHNHVLHETPRIMYMHVAGHGNAARLAQTMKDVLAMTKTPAPNPNPAPQPQDLDIDTAAIEQALGHKGKVNGGVLQVSVARGEAISESGMKVPASMGISTALNFQPTGNGKAAITGDFVLLGSEVNPVIKALEEGRIQVTALHSHMLDEQPRLFFMHFWANDDALKLTRGLRAALDKTNSTK
jgi:hypothetical protein